MTMYHKIYNRASNWSLNDTLTRQKIVALFYVHGHDDMVY
jgi:hypothetical protein